MWFRNDLRVKDNEALTKACEVGDLIFPVYVIDQRLLTATELGFNRAGSFRIQFLLESLTDLKSSLKGLGADLIVRVGNPEEVIPQLVQEYGISRINYNKEVGHEELLQANVIEETVLKKGVLMESFWQSTLFHEEDVPWPVKQVPEVFTKFRKESEKTVEVRPEFHCHNQILFNKSIDVGEIPSLESLGIKPDTQSTKVVLDFKGGETSAWQRLEDYFWKDDLLKSYKYTRNELIGKDYSSKLSPWLATGCISAKSIYFEIKRYEQERSKNSSTYWLFFELLWRDFFKFMTKKHGRSIFLPTGITQEQIDFNNNNQAFSAWKNGETGESFIDANIKELNSTGFMSNRGRQNVASYLIHDLGVNWTWGAMWFENRLIDYDVSSNWLNWAYIAGVGNDPKKGRKFNIENQASKYDPKGKYVKLWLEEEPKEVV